MGDHRLAVTARSARLEPHPSGAARSAPPLLLPCEATVRSDERFSRAKQQRVGDWAYAPDEECRR
jgi:hypothetical protein